MRVLPCRRPYWQKPLSWRRNWSHRQKITFRQPGIGSFRDNPVTGSGYRFDIFILFVFLFLQHAEYVCCISQLAVPLSASKSRTWPEKGLQAPTRWHGSDASSFVLCQGFFMKLRQKITGCGIQNGTKSRCKCGRT